MSNIDDTVGKLARVYDSQTDTWIPLSGVPVPHIHNLSSAGDVDITEPLADNEILQYSTSASAFINTDSPAFDNMSATNSTISTSDLNQGLFKTSKETIAVSATAATGTVQIDSITSSIHYYTSSASANWVFNIRGNSSTTLNSIMNSGETLTVAFLVTNGATPYYLTSIQVDGTTSGVTTEWQGGSSPTSGNANSIDAYTLTVIKTADATFTVLAAQTQYA